MLFNLINILFYSFPTLFLNRSHDFEFWYETHLFSKFVVDLCWPLLTAVDLCWPLLTAVDRLVKCNTSPSFSLTQSSQNHQQSKAATQPAQQLTNHKNHYNYYNHPLYITPTTTTNNQKHHYLKVELSKSHGRWDNHLPSSFQPSINQCQIFI